MSSIEAIKYITNLFYYIIVKLCAPQGIFIICAVKQYGKVTRYKGKSCLKNTNGFSPYLSKRIILDSVF